MVLQKLFLIALGGNIPSSDGGPEVTLERGLEALESHGVTIASVSRFYATPCFPKGTGPDYVNAAANLRAGVTPAEMMDILHAVEAEFGRARMQRWGQRTLDLDLLAMDDAVLPDLQTYEAWRTLPLSDQMTRAPEDLILPHPRLHERAFVLVPLAEVAPEWRHPVLGHSVIDMLKGLPKEDVEEVVPL